MTRDLTNKGVSVILEITLMKEVWYERYLEVNGNHLFVITIWLY